MRPEYLEPRTDVAAAEDWSTRMILAECRWVGRVLGVATLVCAALTVGVVVLATTPGAVGAAVLLGLATVFGSLGLLVCWAEGRPHRTGLLDAAWRRCPATTAATDDTAVLDRLIVFDDPSTVVVRAILPDVTDPVSRRQELFLCGPDHRGRVAIRVAGLCRMFRARVVRETHRPRERDAHHAERPLDDPEVARAFRTFRWGARSWLYPAAAGVAGTVELLLSMNPAAPVGFVVAGVLFAGATVLTPATIMLSTWYRQAVEGVRSATSWTPTAVTLFPWEPDREVAGIARLPGGTALVQFPVPNLDVVANIADTGTMWIAGDPRDVIAVGLPHLPVLTFGLLQRDKNEPDEPRQPLALRSKLPALRGIPALHR